MFSSVLFDSSHVPVLLSSDFAPSDLSVSKIFNIFNVYMHTFNKRKEDGAGALSFSPSCKDIM